MNLAKVKKKQQKNILRCTPWQGQTLREVIVVCTASKLIKMGSYRVKHKLIPLIGPSFKWTCKHVVVVSGSDIMEVICKDIRYIMIMGNFYSILYIPQVIYVYMFLILNIIYKLINILYKTLTNGMTRWPSG